MRGLLEDRKNMQCLAVSQHCQARGAGDISHLKTNSGLARVFHQQLWFTYPVWVLCHKLLGLGVRPVHQVAGRE